MIQNYEFKNPLADPYPGISTCEAMIRNLFLTLKATRRPPAKAIAVQQKILRLSAIVVLDDRIALIIFLLSSVCAVVNTTCCTWIDTFGEGET